MIPNVVFVSLLQRFLFFTALFFTDSQLLGYFTIVLTVIRFNILSLQNKIGCIFLS